MKHLKEAIQVRCSGPRPFAFRRSRHPGRTYVIQRILRTWIVQTAWWDKEARHVYYEVVTDHGVYLICCRSRAEDVWYLAGIHD